MMLCNELLSRRSEVFFLKLRHHCIEVGPQIFRRKIVRLALPVTGVDGFRDLQAITLRCGNEFRWMFPFETRTFGNFHLFGSRRQ